MKRILFITIVLLLIAGCSKAPDTGTQTGMKVEPADTAPQTQVQQEPAEVPEPEPACTNECEQVTAFCDGSDFYACVQEGRCKKIIHIDECRGDYSCENTVFCSSPTQDTKIGMMVKNQLLQFTPVKAEPGEKFNLNFGEEQMICSINREIKGMVVFECK